ncbi:hypothetical protein ROZALSC1DRAFT_28027 [Rozella allomycis CSF55]|uniref:Mitotic-spindle organizing protein associated with a ring of gamma-tubulin 1 n=1 Tax=Rozella allomycis (strain CSF55) TaxID=988480 RepID=A0A075ATT0_ROZAC|nr:hypothetical protein O9G_000433 [Rozella allomycis CSF55]RKP20479.1 hypothetical protein ROZALSC1DRAFT_28027 [Rozella allomycis CSF55]|eukprot:EPZ33658.1 hypothetical protein O9G_000433 [Rozella allomycis CSF55]
MQLKTQTNSSQRIDELYDFFIASGLIIEKSVFKTIVELLQVPVSPFQLLLILNQYAKDLK